MIETEIFRHNELIDPQLHVWGWQIPVYLFLGGLAAGVMIVAALASRRVAVESQSRAMRLLPFAAPILISIGMLALFLDLENKLHVFRFYTAFRLTSPMSWGAWILVAIYPATILFGLARLTEAESKIFRGVEPLARFARGCTARLATINIALGIALGAYTGILLGTLAARALWGSILLAPLFLVSGISTGIAFLLLFRISPEERALLTRWDIAAIAFEILLIAALFLDLATDGGARGRAAADLFFGGSYTAAFWSLVVVSGLFVPLFLEIYERRAHAARAIVAPALLLIGGLALRWIFVLAGQATV